MFTFHLSLPLCTHDENVLGHAHVAVVFFVSVSDKGQTQKYLQSYHMHGFNVCKKTVLNMSYNTTPESGLQNYTIISKPNFLL